MRARPILNCTMSLEIMLHDVVYYVSLAACISLGGYYKKIEDKEMKRNYGTGLGIFITFLICGYHIYHSVLIIWGNIIIIKCCDKRYVHQLSLAYTWTYIAYMNFNIALEGTPYELWIHQVIALRLVGLAFEIHALEKLKVEPKTKASCSKRNSLELESLPEDITALDIIAYAYYFIGLHKGPYYRWRIFQDHFKTRFGALGDCSVITEQKIKKALVCSTLYVILRAHFPYEMYYDDVFYETYDTDNRYLYNIPQLVMYCLHYQVILMLCTSVCTEAGFGVYPAKCLAVPGHGPTACFSFLKLTTETTEVALEEEYNFAMLRCFENDKLLFGPRMRDTLRGWDISTRYWFLEHTYKNVIKSSKRVRKTLTFVAWSLWCGPTLQQLIISTTFWVHIQLEIEYSAMYENTEAMKMPWDIGFSIMRIFCLVYLTPCLILQDTTTVLKYYSSIYWIYHLLLISLVVGSVFIKSKLIKT